MSICSIYNRHLRPRTSYRCDNFKSQDSREIVLQFGNGFLYSEEKEANLLSSTFCIDAKHNKILVPYAKLRGFFKHHLILRVFNMNGNDLEKEELI